MTGPRRRDRWVVTLALVATALAATAAVLRPRAPFDDAVRSTALALVVLTTICVGWQRGRAARLAWLFAVPAVLVGRQWQLGLSVPSASVGWFAYQPLPNTAYIIAGRDDASDALFLAVGALTLVLWTLTTLGLLALVTDARPVGGSVRALAVVAVVLTVPLWVPLATRTSDGGDHLAGGPISSGLAVVRVIALVLVVVVGAAVVLARSVVPARAAAYLVPAVALTWVWWRTEVHAGPGAAPISGLDFRPTWVDALPWTVATIAETALVAILWVLTVRGARVLFARYRPPEALLTP